MNRDIGNMYEKQRFTTLDIEQFLNTNEYQVIDDFSYAEIEGIAKVCGYQIVFFYLSDNIAVLSIDDVVGNPFLVDKANQILSYLDFEFKIGHPFELTEQFNHNYIFKYSIYEDEMNYYYDFQGMLLVLGINWQGDLVSFELVKDESIINNRLEIFST